MSFFDFYFTIFLFNNTLAIIKTPKIIHPSFPFEFISPIPVPSSAHSWTISSTVSPVRHGCFSFFALPSPLRSLASPLSRCLHRHYRKAMLSYVIGRSKVPWGACWYFVNSKKEKIRVSWTIAEDNSFCITEWSVPGREWFTSLVYLHRTWRHVFARDVTAGHVGGTLTKWSH